MHKAPRTVLTALGVAMIMLIGSAWSPISAANANANVIGHGHGHVRGQVLAISHDLPVLGYRKFARLVGVGWGTVKPKEVEQEGDGTAGFSQLRWRKWGDVVTYGRGLFDASLPHGGHREVRGRLRALRLGNCHGRVAR
jgi:hypothetical protein